MTETPFMDKLSSEGIRFTDFHAAASVCTPSRAGLLTGRYGLRTGISGNFGPTSLYGLGQTELTIANVLKSAGGYQTHMIGKHHLGHHSGFHPTYRGFESFLGLPYSGDMGCLDNPAPQGCKPSYNRSQGQPACPALCPPDADFVSASLTSWRDSSGGFEANGGVGIPMYDSVGLNCSGMPSCDATIARQPFDARALNGIYTQRALDLIHKNFSATTTTHVRTNIDSPTTYGTTTTTTTTYGTTTATSLGEAAAEPEAGTRKPVLLYMAFAHTHTPLAYSERFSNASNRAGFSKVFGNTLAEVDHSIGAVVEAIDAAGLGEDTLFLLTGDNGPADLPSVDCDDIGSSGPYQGEWQRSKNGGGGGSTKKTTTWEGGHRVVGLARWTGKIHPRTSHALTSTLDYMPTLASLAGIELPSDRDFDGVDLSKVMLEGDDTALESRVLFHQSGNAELDTMRVGHLKAFYKTAGAGPCRKPDGSHDPSGKTITHYPPLVFNVTADPQESMPIKATPAQYEAFDKARASKMSSISNGFKSHTDYASGGPKAWPCCNRKSSCCRCD